MQEPAAETFPGTPETRALFAPSRWRSYLDTASYGLPPLATVQALESALRAWQQGTANWAQDWDASGEDCRRYAAGLLSAPTKEIALLPSVSVGAGLIGASLGPDDEVVVADDEFRSILFPVLAAERARGTVVRRVRFEEVAESIRSSTTLVATSHVRSNGGAVQDLAAVSSAAREHGARVLVDATHSVGVLRVPVIELGLDYVLAAAYKHMLAPRGVAFMRIARDCWERVQPFTASWRSAARPYDGYYGGDLSSLASGAARFDVSLAWHAWVGARESFRLLWEGDQGARESWSVGLASRLAEELGQQPTGSSIVSIPVRDPDQAKQRLQRASISAALVVDAIRVSFHIYNTPEDVAGAAQALAPLIPNRAR